MAALDKMSVEYKNTFTVYTTFLDSIGLGLFDESPGLFSRRNVKFFVFSVGFFPFAAIQFSLLLNFGTHDFLENAQVVPFLLFFFTDFVKVGLLIKRREQIRRLFIEIGELWPTESQRSVEQRDIMSRLLRRNNKRIYIFFAFATANMFAYETTPLVNTIFSALFGDGLYELPFRVPDYWPLENFYVYLLTLFYEHFSSIPSQMCLYLPTDVLIVVFCSNISILFSVLQSDLKNAIQRRHDRTNRLLYYSDQESYNKVVLAVKTHQRLYRLARQISDIFGILLLIHMISSSIIICFFGFLTIVHGTIADKALYLMTVFNVTLMIFILAVAGQVLYDASADVADAAYESLWFESDIKVRKAMLFIITRAQRPSYLSALGYSDMTLRTFSKIMSSAWTYFNLLIQVFGDI